MTEKNDKNKSGGSDRYGYQPKDSGGSGTSGVRSGYQPAGSGGSPTNPPPKKP